MKLTFTLFLALTVGAAAQTPTVVPVPGASSTSSPATAVKTSSAAAKPGVKTSSAAAKTGAQSVKPSPAVKVTSANAAKSVVTVKPAVVAVQPVPGKVASVPAAKTPAGPNQKGVPVTAAKPNAIQNIKVATVPAKATPSSAAKDVVAPAVKVNPAVAAGKPGVVKPVIVAKPTVQAVPAGHGTVAAPVAHVAAPPKPAAVALKGAPVKAVPNTKDPFAGKNTASKPAVAVVHPVAAKPVGTVVAVKDTKPVEEKKPVPRKIDAAGRRDPFVSPVINLGAVGAGCSSGKRCLAIDQVALRGVVKSEVGMIAVVVNAMDKAYFLRENDPVFNGYVVKITGDSIVFKETFKDKLGKPLTRDVTKTISRPVA